jgi:hypothetical protein
MATARTAAATLAAAGLAISARGFTRRQAHSPQITHRVDECQHLLPRALGGMPTG